MKSFCVFAVLFLAISCQGRNFHQDERASIARLAKDYLPRIHNGAQLAMFARKMKVNMNDFVDRMMEKAKSFILENGLDPMELPDITKEFEVKDLVGITWHGQLDLTRGWLQDLSTIFRSGDVDVEYKEKQMLITAEIGFQDLLFNYDFTAEVMKLKKSGEIVGKADDVKISFIARVDMVLKTIALEDLKISHIGKIETHFNGLGVIADFVADALSKVAMLIFKDQILAVVENEVRNTLENVLANIDIDDIIHTIVN